MSKNTPTISPSDLVYRNGITYKKFTDFPFNGSVGGRQKGTYKKGIKEGFWEYYYKMMGQIERKGVYKNGNREGLWEWYFKNGQLYSKGTYKDGNREGLWEYYYKNGQIWRKATYKDGKEEGLHELYDKDGNLDRIESGMYKNDTKISD